MKKLGISICLTFSACPDVSLFSKFLVCYNGYQGLSWIKISSRFLFYIKSYIDSTIQILKIFFLSLRGEKSLMVKRRFFDVHFERNILTLGHRPMGHRPMGHRPMGHRPMGHRPMADGPMGNGP